MDRSLLFHAIAFLYLCMLVSLILSCYREESVARIIKETTRRSLKFVFFIALLAGITYGIEFTFVNY
ncbi:MAG: hypothetical protein ACKVS6_13470 [Planctomycetota bacterium]